MCSCTRVSACVTVVVWAGCAATAWAQLPSFDTFNSSRVAPPGEASRGLSEPNDTLASAVDLGEIEDTATVVYGAEIGDGSYPETDKDTYRFEIPGGGGVLSPRLVTLAAYAKTDELDGYLRLFDAAGDEIANNDDDAYPDLDAVIRTYTLSPGTYYVGVSASGNAVYDNAVAESGIPGRSQGAYDLTIVVRSVDLTPSVLEPNDDEASAVDTGGTSYTVTGEFIGDRAAAGRSDIDMYKIPLAGPAIIEANVSAEDYYHTTLDPKLTLASANGNIAVNDNANLDTYDAHIKAAVFAGGDYYLTVEGAGNSVGYYDLSITITPIGDAGGPHESNDSILEATPTGLVGIGEVTLSGYVGDGRFAATRGDVDVYEIPTYDGDELTIDVDAAVIGSDLDSLVVVYDYLGEPIAANDNDGDTTDSRVVVTARTPGADLQPTLYELPTTLYAMVLGTRQVRPADPLVPNPDHSEARASEHAVGPSGSSTGTYNITFSTQPGPYDCCEAHPRPGCDDAYVEECVCGYMPSCCWDDWDEECVAAVYIYTLCGTCPERADKGDLEVEGVRTERTLSAVPVFPRVFASDMSFPGNTIVEIDPSDGTEINRFTAPDGLLNGSEGLAVLDDSLYYAGVGRFPRLYQLDPDTGDVLDETVLWSGSGYYADIAVLNGQVYVADLLEHSVHVLDPVTKTVSRTLDVGAVNGITFSGGMATLTHPDRLVLGDAVGSNGLYVLDPASGVVEGAILSGLPCVCDGDFDHDGDVDDDDLAFFDECWLDWTRPECIVADLDCDGDRQTADRNIVVCQHNGPDEPPNEGCCPEVLPPRIYRPTALGGSGSDTLFVHDWLYETIEVRLATGELADVLSVETPLGAIGGQPFFPLGDGDGDGDVDLDDFAMFADCLNGPGGGLLPPTCDVFDAEVDSDVDVDDFAAFQVVFGQGGGR